MVRKHGKQDEARPAEGPGSKPGTAFHSKLVNYGNLHRPLDLENIFGDGDELDSYKAAKRLKVASRYESRWASLRGSSAQI